MCIRDSSANIRQATFNHDIGAVDRISIEDVTTSSGTRNGRTSTDRDQRRIQPLATGKDECRNPRTKDSNDRQQQARTRNKSASGRPAIASNDGREWQRRTADQPRYQKTEHARRTQRVSPVSYTHLT